MVDEIKWKPTHTLRLFAIGEKPAVLLKVMKYGGAEYYTQSTWDEKAPADLHLDHMTNRPSFSGRILSKYGERQFELMEYHPGAE